MPSMSSSTAASCTAIGSAPTITTSDLIVTPTPAVATLSVADPGVRNGQERTFSFLGPWDADLEKGRLDYHAPLARSFMGHGVGSTVRAQLNRRMSQFEILEIGPAV